MIFLLITSIIEMELIPNLINDNMLKTIVNSANRLEHLRGALLRLVYNDDRTSAFAVRVVVGNCVVCV